MTVKSEVQEAMGQINADVRDGFQHPYTGVLNETTGNADGMRVPAPTAAKEGSPGEDSARAMKAIDAQLSPDISTIMNAGAKSTQV